MATTCTRSTYRSGGGAVRGRRTRPCPRLRPWRRRDERRGGSGDERRRGPPGDGRRGWHGRRGVPRRGRRARGGPRPRTRPRSARARRRRRQRCVGGAAGAGRVRGDGRRPQPQRARRAAAPGARRGGARADHARCRAMSTRSPTSRRSVGPTWCWATACSRSSTTLRPPSARSPWRRSRRGGVRAGRGPVRRRARAHGGRPSRRGTGAAHRPRRPLRPRRRAAPPSRRGGLRAGARGGAGLRVELLQGDGVFEGWVPGGHRATGAAGAPGRSASWRSWHAGEPALIDVAARLHAVARRVRMITRRSVARGAR